MTVKLTKIAGVPDRERLVRGMAHFAGTGPPGTLCRECTYWGFYNKDHKLLKAAPCEKHRKLLQLRKHGPPVPASTRSCRHFEARGLSPG
jgi:hypothetical protein